MKNVTMNLISCLASLACLLALTAWKPAAVSASPRAARADAEFDVTGTWEGTLDAGAQGKLRVVVHISKAADGSLTGTLDSPDQNAAGIPISKISFKDPTLSFESEAIGGSYEGKLDKDKGEFAGTWTQGGGSLELNLKRQAKAESK